MAALAVIGYADTHLRLGGSVQHFEHGPGTVARITAKGKIAVQFHNPPSLRVCRLQDLTSVRIYVFHSFILTSKPTIINISYI